MTRARELAFIANENLLTGDTTNLRIGIGSTVPASALDVKGSISATGDADFSGNITIGGTLTYQDVTNVDAVGIITANSGIHITGGGLRVVGVTTGLSVSGVLTTGNGLTNNYIKIGRTGNFVIDTVPGNNRLRIDPSGILEIGAPLGGGNNSGVVVGGVSTITSNVNIGVGGTTAFFDIANRRVGFGTIVPDTPLHIYRNDAQLVTVERSTLNNAGIRYRNTLGSMFAGLMSNAEGWAIDDDDNLGQNPMFHVVKSTGDTVVRNHLGINSTTPQDHAGLVINAFGGNANDNVALAIRSYQFNQYLRIARGGSSAVGDVAITNNFTRTGGAEWTIDTPSNDVNAIQFSATDGIRFRHIDAPGTATISSYPSEIAKIYADGIQLAQNKGINFYNYGSGTNISNNFLDDYEEGTWTPAYIGSTSNPTLTYDIQGGRYVKIGRVVHCEGRLRTDAKSGGSGNLKISGLPFTSAPESTVRAGIDIGVASAFGSNRPTEGLVTHNSTQIGLYRATSNSYANITTADMGTTTNDNSLQFSVTYMAAS